MFRRTIIVCALVCLYPLLSQAIPTDLPQWQFDDTWKYEEHLRIIGQQIGANGYLELNTDANYVVYDMGIRTQAKSGVDYDCYEVRFYGQAHGGGIADVQFKSEVPVRMQVADYNGVYWMERDTLAMVMRSRKIRGPIEALVFGNWLGFGEATIVLVEEYVPAIDDYGFPLDVGNHSEQSVQIYAYGRYDVPAIATDLFDENFAIDFNISCTEITQIGNLDTYKIVEHTGMVMGQQEIYYSPEAEWYAWLDLSGLAFGTELQIETGYMELISYNIQPDPTHTPTPSPTDTPTPTSTPTNTPTPTFTPSVRYTARPVISMAGYLNTDISRFRGGTMEIIAHVTDPDQRTIRYVQIFANGYPTGITLEPMAINPEYYMFGPVNVGPGLPSGDYLLELGAIDFDNSESYIWPYFTVEPAIAPAKAQLERVRTPWTSLMARTIMKGLALDDSSPQILAAGYDDSTVLDPDGGTFRIIAVIVDPQGGSDIDEVYVLAGGAPTGVTLNDDGQNGDDVAGDSIFTYEVNLSSADVTGMAGQYLLELVAIDSGSHLSDIWPYLHID